MAQVLVLVDDESQLQDVQSGITILKNFGISFSLRLASPFDAPDLLKDLLSIHQESGGKAVICVSNAVNHLAGFVAANSVNPVLAIPMGEQETVTSKLGYPIAMMPPGMLGFSQAAVFLAQIIGVFSTDMGKKVKQDRQSRMARMVESDDDNRIDFNPE